MPVSFISDQAQQFATLRATGAIKSDLGRLAASLSSGRVADITKHLGGNTAQLSGIQHRLTQLEGYQQIGRETAQTLDTIQQVLLRIDTARAQLSEQLLTINDSSVDAQVDTAARTARGTLDTLVSALNTRLADRALLGGRVVDTPPVITAEEIMTQVRDTIGPDRTAAGITAAVAAWFDDPTIGFLAVGYRGDADGFMQRQISDDRQIDITLRADDPAFRETLKSTVLAAIAADLPNLSGKVKSDLVQSAGAKLFGAGSGLIDAQARVGTAQATLTTSQTEFSGQETGLKLALNGMTMADPFETATRLQNVQLQLETHYAVVGRLSQLSLLRFI